MHKMSKPITQYTSNIQAQSGLSLLITVVVLLGLTLIAITLANSNQSQAIMARNNQLRVEVFNASFSEINAQTDAINSRNISEGPPPYIDALVNTDLNTVFTPGRSGFTVLSQARDGFSPSVSSSGDVAPVGVGVELEMVNLGTCLAFGSQIGEGGVAQTRCFQFRLDVEARLDGTEIASEQHQMYQYQTLR